MQSSSGILHGAGATGFSGSYVTAACDEEVHNAGSEADHLNEPAAEKAIGGVFPPRRFQTSTRYFFNLNCRCSWLFERLTGINRHGGIYAGAAGRPVNRLVGNSTAAESGLCEVGHLTDI